MDFLSSIERVSNSPFYKVFLTRLFDFYLTENMPPNELSVYLISVLLFKYSIKLKTLKNEQNIMFLQALPTASWGNCDIQLLVSEAIAIRALFNIEFNT